MKRLVRERLFDVYGRMLRAYGPQRWWPGDTWFEVMVGAVLTQATAWVNVEKAISNLKSAKALSPRAVRDLPEPELARLIYPSGSYNAKARKLKALAEYLGRYADDVEAMAREDASVFRTELLGVYGVGEETADDILLYAIGKAVFVVDGYTRRILHRLGLAPEKAPYSTYSSLFTQHLSADPVLYNEYHALMVRHAKEACRKNPLCGDCCLLDVCPTGKRLLAGGGETDRQPNVRHL